MFFSRFVHRCRWQAPLAGALVFALALGACGRPEDDSSGPSSPARALEALFSALWNERAEVAGRYLNEASRELLLGSEDGAAPVVVWLPSEGDLAQTEIEAGSDDDHVTVVLSLRSGVVVRIPAARVDGTWQFDLRP